MEGGREGRRGGGGNSGEGEKDGWREEGVGGRRGEEEMEGVRLGGEGKCSVLLL